MKNARDFHKITMRQTDRASWLDITAFHDRRLSIQDHGRLRTVVKELPHPSYQHPTLCVFLGDRVKDVALQQLYPQNNIKRHDSGSSIKLRYDIISFSSTRPVLFADGNPHKSPSLSNCGPEDGLSNPVLWDSSSTQNPLLVIWTRLVFVFTQVICIFGDDFDGLKGVADFLIDCIKLQSASSLPIDVRPRVIIALKVRGEGRDEHMLQTELFYHQLNGLGDKLLSNCFSGINFIYLDDSLSPAARYERLRDLIKGQLDDMTLVNQDHGALPSGFQLVALFEAALQHMTATIDQPFNIVEATRTKIEATPDFISRLTHFYQIGIHAGVAENDLSPLIGTALLMDHYVPDMLGKITSSSFPRFKI